MLAPEDLDAIRLVVREEIAAFLAPLARSQPSLVTVAEYARLSSLSIKTVRNLVRAGRLECVRIGRFSVRIPRAAKIERDPVVDAIGKRVRPMRTRARVEAQPYAGSGSTCARPIEVRTLRKLKRDGK